MFKWVKPTTWGFDLVRLKAPLVASAPPISSASDGTHLTIPATCTHYWLILAEIP